MPPYKTEQFLSKLLRQWFGLVRLLPEVPVQQPLEGLSMSGLVPCHFVDGVVVGLRPTGGDCCGSAITNWIIGQKEAIVNQL